MAVVDVLVGYAVFRTLRGVDRRAAAFVAGWAAITVSALVVGLGLGLSSAFAYQLDLTLAVMGVGHALLGTVEGAITAVVFAAVVDRRPDLFGDENPAPSEVSA